MNGRVGPLMLGSHACRAGQFAHELLSDAEEAFAQGLEHAWEIAEYLGAPVETARMQAGVRQDGAIA